MVNKLSITIKRTLTKIEDIILLSKNNKINIINKIYDKYKTSLTITNDKDIILKYIRLFIDEILQLKENNKHYLLRNYLLRKYFFELYVLYHQIPEIKNSILTTDIDHIKTKSSQIYLQLKNHLKIDIKYYTLKMKSIENESDSKHNFSILIDDLNVIINSIDILSKNVDKNLKKIYTIIDEKINNKLFKQNKSQVNNWNIILLKIKNYNKNMREFDIFDIRTIDTPEVIIQCIMKYIIKDICIYNKLLNSILEKKDKESYQFIKNILKIYDNLKSVVKNINNTKNYSFDDLEFLNETINVDYENIIKLNISLNLDSLRKSKEYEKTFSTEINWINICSEIRKYLYRKVYFNRNIKRYTSIKCPLKSVIGDNDNIFKINKIVFDVNNIVTNTYFFIQLYVEYEYETNIKKVETVNKLDITADVTSIDFINMAMRAIVKNDPRGANMTLDNIKLLEKIQEFYKDNKHKFNKLIQIDATGLQLVA